MNKEKVKCYIYTRVSTANQVDGYSLDAQRETMRKYADFQNMEIVREYSDEGHSGKNIRGLKKEYCRESLAEIETGVQELEKYLIKPKRSKGEKIPVRERLSDMIENVNGRK